MSTLLALGGAMAFGLLFNRFAKKVGLPNVTGYLVAGLAIGPFGLRILSGDALAAMDLVTTAALGFIAFSIGGEFKFSYIKQIGVSALTITLCESLGAVALVNAVLAIAGFDPALFLPLSAIAAATAPAATLMVVRQYRAKGPVTSVLLPVVAMDDAVGLIVFSVSLSVAKMLGAGAGLSVGAMLLSPAIEIFGALLSGGVLGLALTFFLRFFKSRANRMMLALTAVFLGVAVAEQFDFSSLLLCMALGATMVNLCDRSDEILSVTDEWTPPLFMLFFVISGAELNLAVLPTVGLLGALYVVFRALGKYLGASLGSRLRHMDPNICKYLGFTLIPQAGVAIGMSQVVVTALPQYSEQIRAVVLCATLIYELTGPLITKFVLTRAGEIQKTEKRKTPAGTAPQA